MGEPKTGKRAARRLGIAVLVVAGVVIGAYGHDRWQRWQRESAPPRIEPHAVFTVLSAAPAVTHEGLDVHLRIEYHGVRSWVVRPGDAGGGLGDGRWIGWGELPETATSSVQERTVTLYNRNPDRDDRWGKNYVTMATGTDHETLDWRSDQLLVELGKPYTVKVGERLLLGRRIAPDDGTVAYWRLMVQEGPLSPRADAIAKPPPEIPRATYWPVRATFDGDKTIHVELAGTGGVWPEHEELAQQLAPRYRLVEEQRVREIPAKVEISYDRNQSRWCSVRPVKIVLADTPTDPQDLFFACDLSEESLSHPALEVPIRRRRFYGDVYPLGVVAVTRGSIVGPNELFDMRSYRIWPGTGAIIGYGRDIYRIDPTSLERALLWRCPKPNTRVEACAGTPDGRILVFSSGSAINQLDVATGKIVATSVWRKESWSAHLRSLQVGAQGKRFCAVSSVEEHHENQVQVSLVGIPDGNAQSVLVRHDHQTPNRKTVTKGVFPRRCALTPDLAVALVSFDCGCIIAYDTKSGAVLWQTEEPSPRFVPAEGRLLQGNVWICAGDRLCRRDARTGAELPAIPLEGWYPFGNEQGQAYIGHWVHDTGGGLLAATVGRGQRGDRNVVLFRGTDTLSAVQCIPNCFPRQTTFNRERTSVIGFLDRRHLLLRHYGLAGGRNGDDRQFVSDLLLVDLDLVPSLQ
jgi:hypothetical protein